MCKGIIWNNSLFLVGGRAWAEARIDPRPLRTSRSTAHGAQVVWPLDYMGRGPIRLLRSRAIYAKQSNSPSCDHKSDASCTVSVTRSRQRWRLTLAWRERPLMRRVTVRPKTAPKCYRRTESTIKRRAEASWRGALKLREWTSTDWTTTIRFCPLQVQQRWPVSSRSLLTYSIVHQRSLWFLTAITNCTTFELLLYCPARLVIYEISKAITKRSPFLRAS